MYWEGFVNAREGVHGNKSTVTVYSANEVLY